MMQTEAVIHNTDVDALFDFLGAVNPEYREEPLPIEEWIANPFYCGENGIGLYPFWKEELIRFYNSGHSEWVIFGSLGGGKTTVADVALMYKLYRISCLYDIPGYFGLLPSSILYSAYFSVNLTQAERTGYGKLKRMVDATPYFQTVFPRDPHFNSELRFPGIHVIYGSSQAHQIGLDLICAVLDEADFFKEGTKGIEQYSEAKAIYQATTNRRKLRFSKDGKDLGLSILISSPAFMTDFAEKKMVQAEKQGTAYVTRVVGYEVMRHKFSPTTFVVFPGNETVEPAIINNEQDMLEVLHLNGIEEEQGQGLNALVAKYKERLDLCFVPDDLKQVFEDDIGQAVRDVLGRSTRAAAGYLTDDQVLKVVDPYMRHPFRTQTICLSNLADVEIQEFWMPRPGTLFPKELPRFIHIDQSYRNDRTGIACSVVIASPIDDGDPITATEWCLAVTPPAQGEIPILRVAEFPVWLRNAGFNVILVTMDSYQSRASLQYLWAEGIDAKEFSVDRTDEAYVTLRGQILDGRHKMYDYSIARKELRDLIWDRKRRKVDHPSNGSKDVADCIAASVHQAVLYHDAMPGAYYSDGNDFDEIEERIQRQGLLAVLEEDFVDVTV